MGKMSSGGWQEGRATYSDAVFGLDLKAEDADSGGYLGDVGDRKGVQGLGSNLGMSNGLRWEKNRPRHTGSRGSLAVRSMWLSLLMVCLMSGGCGGSDVF